MIITFGTIATLITAVWWLMCVPLPCVADQAITLAPHPRRSHAHTLLPATHIIEHEMRGNSRTDDHPSALQDFLHVGPTTTSTKTLIFPGWFHSMILPHQVNTALNDAKTKNALLKLNGKTAIVFGGTSGIGHSLAVRFAQAGSNVYIVGRSEKAAAAILEEMKGFNVADATYRFVASDLSLLANARAAVKQLPEELKVVDYVVFCQTKSGIQGRTPTVENIDEIMSLNYFSRIELVRQLLPRLEAAEDARVLSVLSAGVHSPYNDYDIDFEVSSKFSLKKAADAAGFYTDLAFDHLSRQHPKVTFIHASPGFVSTNWGTDMPMALRLTIRALQATVAKASSDCAEFLFPSLTQPDQRGNGKVHLIGEYGQDVTTTTLHTDEAVAFVWQETETLIETVGVPPPTIQLNACSAYNTSATSTILEHFKSGEGGSRRRQLQLKHNEAEDKLRWSLLGVPSFILLLYCGFTCFFKQQRFNQRAQNNSAVKKNRFSPGI